MEGVRHHGLRRERYIFGLFRRPLGDRPVLAIFAVEIAACSRDRKGETSREDVIKRLFFDRVDMHGARIAVHEAVQFSVDVGPDAAVTAAAFRDAAVTGTELAFDNVHGDGRWLKVRCEKSEDLPTPGRSDFPPAPKILLPGGGEVIVFPSSISRHEAEAQRFRISYAQTPSRLEPLSPFPRPAVAFPWP